VYVILSKYVKGKGKVHPSTGHQSPDKYQQEGFVAYYNNKNCGLMK